MKKRLIVFLLVLCSLLLISTAAMAATDPIEVKMQLSNNTFTKPEEITVSIQISNTGDTDMPGPVTLYYPDGTQIEEFGSPTLAAGTQKSWEGTWTVTEEQLSSGRITFRVKYSITGDDGTLVSKTKNFAKAITYTGGVASIEVKRTISPTTAGTGKTVNITYEIINTGTVEITDVSITENKTISATKGTIARIPVGEKASYTFSVAMGKKDLTSKATITYKAGGKEQKTTKEAATIKYGEVKLNATLTGDKKGGTAGEIVKLTLTLKNTGKEAYSGITVTDPTLGELFTDQTVAAGKTLTLEQEITLNENMDLQFTITGENASGDPVETSTDLLSLSVIDASQLLDLKVEATVDSETVYQFPSIVKFRVYVTNNSTVDVTNVTVSASGMTLYTFPSILSGETREFTRDVSIQMAGQYQFVATTKDQLNQSQSFNSNIIRISYSTPTAAPTEVPLIAPSQPDYEQVPTSIHNSYAGIQGVLGNVGNILCVIAGVGLLLMIISIARKVMLKVQYNKALAHLDTTSVRDYVAENEDLAQEDDTVVRRQDTDPDPEDLPGINDEQETADPEAEETSEEDQQ